MKKRILALALTLAMLLSLFPGQVFATETPTEHTEHNFVEVQPETEPPTEIPDVPETVPPTETQSSTENEAPTEASAESPEEFLSDNKSSAQRAAHSHSTWTQLNSGNWTTYIDSSNGTFKNEGYYVLTSNIELPGHLKVYKDVTICLNGFNLTFDDGYHVQTGTTDGKNKTFTLMNCKSSGSLAADYAGTVINVAVNTTFKLESGTVQNINAASTGILCSGKVYISGGTVVAHDLGLSFADSGAAEIIGGEIYAIDTGGVGMRVKDQATVYFKGGTIRCDKTDGIGIDVNSGNLYLTCPNDTIPTVARGTEYGIDVSGGTVSVKSATVEGNVCGINASGGETTVHSGTVTGGKSTSTDATRGLYLKGGKAEIKGGTVTANGTNSEGIRTLEGTELTITGGTVQGTKTGIYNTGTIHLNGGTVTSTGDYAITVNSKAVATNMSGAPSLTGNKAEFYLPSGKVINLTGAVSANKTYRISMGTPLTDPGTQKKIATSWSTGARDTSLFTSIDNFSPKVEGNDFYFFIPELTVSASTGGTVTPDVAGGTKGTVVTLTPQPAEGYSLTSLRYSYLDGSQTVTGPVGYQNGVYSMTMPGADVTVSATFDYAHKHCIYGNRCDGLMTQGTCNHTDQLIPFVKELSQEDLAQTGDFILSDSGAYYLTSDLVLRENQRFVVGVEDVKICLNGHKIIFSGTGHLTSNEGAHTLTICDCSPEKTGEIKGIWRNVVAVNESCVTTLRGITVRYEPSSAYEGGSAVYNDKGTLVLDGCNVITQQHIHQEPHSNGIQNNLGTVTIKDSSVSSYDNALLNNGNATIEGDSVLETANTGTNVIYTENGTLTMTGGTVKGMGTSNSALWVKGGSATISGGTIDGASNGIYLNETGSLTISGGAVTGRNGNGIKHEGSALTMEGSPVINGSNGKGDIYLASGKTISITDKLAPENGETYSVYAATPPTVDNPYVQITGDWDKSQLSSKTLGAGNAQIPFTSTQGYVIEKAVAEGVYEVFLMLHHEHCIYGVNCEFKTADQNCTHTEQIEFTTELTQATFTGTLEDGKSYVLMGPVTATKNITVNGTVNLCLNGYTLDLKNYIITVGTGAVLNICDCNGSNSAEGGAIIGSHNTAVIQNTDGELNLYSGKILASGVSGVQNQGTTNIYGGTVVGTTQGILVQSGSVNVNGKNAYILAKGKYGIRVDNAGSVTVTAGTVEGTTEDGIYIHANGTVVIDGADALVIGGKKGINNYGFGAVATISDGTIIGKNDDGIYNGGTLTITGGTISGDESSGQQSTNPGIYINKGTLNISGGTITGSKGIQVNKNTTYAVEINIMDGATISGKNGAGIEMATTKCTTNISGGIIQGTTTGITSSGTLEITGGTVTGGTESGITVSGGTVNMKGGTVTGGQAGADFSCLRISGGTTTITGGEITTQGEHGVFIDNTGKLFIQDEAVIRGNTVVNISGGTVTISGGTMESTGQNTATGAGAGVYFEKGTLKLSGSPVIKGTTADFKIKGNETTGADCLITIAGALTPEKAYSVWVTNAKPTEENPVVFTTGWETYKSSSIAAPFTSHKKEYTTQERITTTGNNEWHLVGFHNHYMAVDWEKGHADPATPNVPGNHADGTAVGGRVNFSTELSGTYSNLTLTEGAYVLRGTVTHSGTLTIQGNVKLCLNGNTLNLGSGYINLGTGKKLEICDCKGGGTIKSKSANPTIDFDTGSGNILSLYSGTVQQEDNRYLAVQLAQPDTFNMYGGNVISMGGGVSVYMKDATLNIYGGTIEAYKRDAVSVTQKAIAKMTGGRIIYYGTSTNYGAVCLGLNGQFTVNGTDAIVNGGVASAVRFNNAKLDQFTLIDGTVEGSVGLAVSEGGTATISGGEVIGTSGYGINNAGTLNLSGSPVINGGAEKGDIYLASGKTITITGTLTPPTNDDGTGEKYSVETAAPVDEFAPVKITTNWTNSGSTTTADDSFVLTSAKGYTVRLDGNELWLVKPHKHYMAVDCVNGHKDKDYQHADGTAVGEQVEFDTALTEAYVQALTIYTDIHGEEQYGLETGNYALSGDITVGKSISIRGDVKLCLNGHKLDLGENSITFNIEKDAKLSICDCSEKGSGTITSTDYKSTILFGSGTLNLFGGTIAHPVKDNTENPVFEDGIQILPSAIRCSGTLNMYGGTITSDHHGIYTVSEENAVVNIMGGTIDVAVPGAGVYSGTCKSIEIKGETVQIIGKTALTAMGGNVTVTAGKLISYTSNSIYIEGGNVTVKEDAVVKGKYDAIALMEGTLNLADAPTITSTGGNACILLNHGMVINILDDIGATYSVNTKQVPTAEVPVRITENWKESGSTTTADNSFLLTSKQGYIVRLKEDGELYFVIPTVTTVVTPEGSGELLADPTSGAMGTQVTLTATPASGYEFIGLKISYTLDGVFTETELTVDENRKATFPMPCADVTATAVFVRSHIHTMSVGCEVVEGENVHFTRHIQSLEDLKRYMDENGVLEAGSYVLEGTVTGIPADIKITGEVNLCLCGKTLNMGAYSINVTEEGTLNICDCSQGRSGRITGTNADGVICVSEGSTMNLYGGTVESTRGTAIHNYGTVNTDGLPSADGNTFRTNINGTTDAIVNEFKATLNVTNTMVSSTAYGNAILNRAGIVTVRKTTVRTQGGDYHSDDCGIRNDGWETVENGETILWGGTVTIEEGTKIKTKPQNGEDKLGESKGNIGIYNRAGEVVVNGGLIDVYHRGIENAGTKYHPISGGEETMNLVTVNGGHIIATEYGIYNVGGDLRVAGGTVEADGSEYHWGGIEAFPTAIYNINGGTVEVSGEDTLVWASRGMSAICNCGGVVTIKDGTLKGTGNNGIVYNGVPIFISTDPNVPAPMEGIPCVINMEGGLLTYSGERANKEAVKGIFNNGEGCKVVMSGGTIDMTASDFVGGSFGIYNAEDSEIVMSGEPEIETLTGDIYLGTDVLIKVAEDGKLLTKEEKGYYTVWTEEVPTTEKNYVQITEGWYDNYKQERAYLFKDARDVYFVYQLKKPVYHELYFVIHSHYMAVDWENGHKDDNDSKHADGTPVGDMIYFQGVIDQNDVPNDPMTPLILGDPRVNNPTDDTLPTYTYVLKSDLRLLPGQNIQINGKVDICLAGNKIILDGGRINIETSDYAPDNVRLCDCHFFDMEDEIADSGIYGKNMASALVSYSGNNGVERNMALYGITIDVAGNSKDLYAVYPYGGTFVAESCTIRVNCTAKSNRVYGLYGLDSHMKVYDSSITVDSSATSHGLYAVGGSLAVYDTTIKVDSNSGSYGVYGTGARLEVYDGSITAESNAISYGVYCVPNNTVPGSVMVDGTVIKSTSKNANADGIFHVGGGDGTIKNVVITSTAKGQANGIYAPGSPVSVENATITATSDSNANGIYVVGRTASVDNATITATSDSTANGIFISGASVSVENTDISAASVNDADAYGIYQGGTLTLLDGVTITGETADIYLITGRTVTLSADDALDVPAGETYSVKTATPPTEEKPVQITTTWNQMNAEVTAYPFTSADYLVMKLDGPVANELYLVVPVVTLYLWKDHNVMLSTEALHKAIMELDTKSTTYKIQAAYFSNAVKDMILGLEVTPADGESGYNLRAFNAGSDDCLIQASYLHLLGNVTTNTSVKLIVKVYDVQDSVFVLDYDKAVKFGDGLFAQDTLPGVEDGETNLVFETFAMDEPNLDEKGLTMTFIPGDVNGTYGTFSVNENDEPIYTPTDGVMLDGADTVFGVLRVYDKDAEASEMGVINPFKEAEMYKKVTILPANTVYYEDDNDALNWNPTENAGIVIETVGKPTGDGYQDGDNNSEYGNDSDYAEAPDGEYYGSGGYSKKITVKAAGPVLTFTFTGTGFDLIGSTTADSGQLMYKVTKKGGSLIQSGALNTVYNGSGETGAAIHEVPLLHVHDLEHGTYEVLIQSVVTYDWSIPKDQWPDGKRPVKTAYLYLDGVRIYNPLAMNSEDRESYMDGEDTARFIQLRDMILKGQAAAAKIDGNGLFSFGSGLVSYAEKAQKRMTYEGNKVTSLNDYLIAGPNNEVYFNENTQTLVLYVKETGEENVTPMLQIGVRNLNPEAFKSTEGDESIAPEFALLGAKGGVVQTLVGPENAIGYTEQYYTVNYKDCVVESINGVNYYRVVITARNNKAFSLTNLKVSGLEFYTIPASAATLRYDENGQLMENTNPDATAMPSLQELAWQLQAANGMLPEDEIPGEVAELKFSAVSLSLQSSIGMNIYVAKENLTGYKDPYVVLTKTVYDEQGNASYVTTTLETYTETTAQGLETLVFHYGDVAAKEMASNVQMQLFATKEGETEATDGEIRDYSVVKYAMNMLNKVTDSKLKTLLVDMVNYGTQAQVYFDYNTANPANAGFESYQEYATTQTPAINSNAVFDDQNAMAPAPEGATDYLSKVAGASLLLNEKVELNIFVNYKDALGNPNEGRTLVVAYSDVFGNTVVKKLPITAEDLDSKSQFYRVTFSSLNATDMRTAFSAWVVDKDGMRISNSMIYSIESYCASMIAGNGAAYDKLRPLLIAMMKYGDSAEAYFEEPKTEEA